MRAQALQWLSTYLNQRRQRVRVDSATSSWLPIPAGVPQGSVLGPLLFLIYTIDLPTACTTRNTKPSLFADDTAVLAAHTSATVAQQSLQCAVTRAGAWLKRWHLLVNPTKTVILAFGTPTTISITLFGTTLQQVTSHRHLGLLIQSDLKWTTHMEYVTAKVNKLIHLLTRIRGSIHPATLGLIYQSYIRPILEYGSIAMSPLTKQQEDTMERLQRRSAKVCLRLPLFQPCHHSSLLHHIAWPTLSSRRKVKYATLGHAIHHKHAPPHVQIATAKSVHQPTTRLRNSRSFSLPIAHTSRFANSPLNSAMSSFNAVPADIRSVRDPATFKKLVSQTLLSSCCLCSNPCCNPVLQ